MHTGHRSQDPPTSRTLTLISKTIQTLGSLAKSKSVSLTIIYTYTYYIYLYYYIYVLYKY